MFQLHLQKPLSPKYRKIRSSEFIVLLSSPLVYTGHEPCCVEVKLNHSDDDDYDDDDYDDNDGGGDQGHS